MTRDDQCCESLVKVLLCGVQVDVIGVCWVDTCQ